ncbi:TolC family protein [Bacteriovorax sp. DB6_IX]|uniref:TolC family protein n=1 Tax=Bacteriovorax sp. DB6_IX TaxID=1353530 RepID=UPI000389DC62|nr:TolC family protein [Bacteriovorax sp. DB6_IX]EQC52447.1 outer membrane efflux protein [Bacteriovorax sp. DB6_IX]
MMNKYSKILLVISAISISANAATFKDLVKNLDKHDQVLKAQKLADALKHKARVSGSWGDPVFKLAAKNFPVDSLKDNETPMTGVEFGLAQKIALSTKYGNQRNAQESMARAMNYQSHDIKQGLVKSLWEIVILRRQILEEINILDDNYNWIKKILKVSKKLYANGRTSQQAILDIEIRKSELEAELSNKKFTLKQLEQQLLYITDGERIDYKSIPWKALGQSRKKLKKIDFKELALKEKLRSSEYKLTASKQNFVPDIMMGVGYTKRSDIDNRGDFISASISFPLPFSSTKYGNYSQNVQENYAAKRELKDYERSKNRDVEVLNFEIEKISSEIDLLAQKTIKFARNSRKITAKSYSLGNSSYVELLQSEIKLQNKLIKKIMLQAQRDMKVVALKYKLGESLYE